VQGVLERKSIPEEVGDVHEERNGSEGDVQVAPLVAEGPDRGKKKLQAIHRQDREEVVSYQLHTHECLSDVLFLLILCNALEKRKHNGPSWPYLLAVRL
jgi:hypothetical protein